MYRRLPTTGADGNALTAEESSFFGEFGFGGDETNDDGEATEDTEVKAALGTNKMGNALINGLRSGALHKAVDTMPGEGDTASEE